MSNAGAVYGQNDLKKRGIMKKIASGKTKDVYEVENGNLVLLFKDDVTGDETGVNPGANEVTGRIEGKGNMSFELTCHFLGLLKDRGIPTHFVSADMGKKTMEVKKAEVFGSKGLEFIWRSVACGSFYRRYKTLVKKEFQELKVPVVEITPTDSGRVSILTKFGPCIFGKVVVQGDLKIKTEISDIDSRAHSGEPDEPGSYFAFFIIIGIAVFIGFIVLVSYLFLR